MLIALAAALVLSSGLAVAFMPTSILNSRTIEANEDALRNRQSLIDARRRLLAYTASYPWLYGPTGAGPGHLPCPDVDSTPGTVTGDGPDPPCAARPYVEGALPRHVTLPSGRLLIHAEPGQTLTYRLGSRYVNNPRGRLVNHGLSSRRRSASVSDDGVTTDTIAWLGRNESGDAIVSIDAVRLHRAARLSVLAWLRSRLADLDPESIPGRMGIAQAETGGSSIVHDSTRESERLTLTGGQSLALLADQVEKTPAEIDSLWLEGVPARRHWFVTNRWVDGIVMELAPDCMGAAVGPCKWRVLSEWSPEAPLTLAWEKLEVSP